MIFKSLQLNNFRIFEGEQNIRFSTDEDSNVTVIHGFNGSGKTTLLYSFVWLFYGDLDNRFGEEIEGEEGNLLNNSAFHEANEGDRIPVKVKSVFEHQGNRYIAWRERMVEKISSTSKRFLGGESLHLSKIDEDGEEWKIDGPQDAMEQLLPRALQPFFFFHGEQIRKLAVQENKDEVERGVKILLDIEILDRAERHLNGDTSDWLREEISKYSGDEGESIRYEIEGLEAELDETEAEIKGLKKDRKSKKNEIERINERLKDKPEVRGLETEREEKNQTLEEVNGEIDSINEQIEELFSNDAYLAPAETVLKSALDTLNEAHEEGEVPPPLRKQFIDELLSNGKCICGNTLEEGTDRYQNVEEWKERTSSDETARIAETVRAQIKRSLLDRGDKFHESLRSLQSEKDEKTNRKRKLEERIGELKTEIKEKETKEDWDSLERRRAELRRDIEEINADLVEERRNKEELENSISEKDKQLEEIEEATERGRKAQRRLRAVKNVADAIGELKERKKQSVRKDLSDYLDTVWEDTTIKSYKAEINSDYSLNLLRDKGSSVVKSPSTGEKQVLSLGFVFSLTQKAQEMGEKATSGNSPFKGGKYPLVMDSPFGRLETDYRKQIAKWAPEHAPQIIMLVSQTQWRNEVATETYSRIGREWILECHTPKETSKEITLNGKSYQYVVHSEDDHEKTKIREVKS